MTDSKTNDENKYLLSERKIIDQQVDGYGREIELVEFTCACPNCPYCDNETFWAHPNRTYCDPDAMLLHRQRTRKLEAIADGRIPGQRGRPFKNPPIHFIYMIQAVASNFYKIDWAPDQETYERKLADNQGAIPKGVKEIFVCERPAGQVVVDTLYEIFGNLVVNGKWIEFSEEQAQEIKSLFIQSDIQTDQ